jgi:hypothetical protein
MVSWNRGGHLIGDTDTPANEPATGHLQ